MLFKAVSPGILAAYASPSGALHLAEIFDVTLRSRSSQGAGMAQVHTSVVDCIISLLHVKGFSRVTNAALSSEIFSSQTTVQPDLTRPESALCPLFSTHCLQHRALMLQDIAHENQLLHLSQLSCSLLIRSLMAYL